jgi:hypothetical protein
MLTLTRYDAKPSIKLASVRYDIQCILEDIGQWKQDVDAEALNESERDALNKLLVMAGMLKKVRDTGEVQ